MIKDLSSKLVAAVSAINQKSREAYVAEQKALEQKKAAKQIKMPTQPAPKADTPAHAGAAAMAKKNVSEGAEGTVPKTPREKALAKMSGDPNKITQGDVLKGRGVRKEAWDDMMKAVKARKDAEGTGKFDKKSTSTGTVHTRKASTFTDGGKDADLKKAEKKMKSEEVDQIDEGRFKKGQDVGKPGMNFAKIAKSAAKRYGSKEAGQRVAGAVLKKVLAKEETEQIDELKKTTVQSYIQKTVDPVYGIPKSPVKIKQRLAGISRAHQRIVGHKPMSEDVALSDAEQANLDQIAASLEMQEAVHPDALHVSPAGGGKYKVHAVGKNFADGIKVGEHLTDSHLDDFAEMGGKIKHIKPPADKKD